MIEHLPKPCFVVLMTETGRWPSWDEEDSPHYDTAEEALNRGVERYAESTYDTDLRDMPSLSIVEQDHRCHVVTCDGRGPNYPKVDPDAALGGCGEVFDRQWHGMTFHFPDRGDADIVTDSDWRLVEHEGKTYALCEEEWTPIHDEDEDDRPSLLRHLGLYTEPADYDPEMENA